MCAVVLTMQHTMMWIDISTSNDHTKSFVTSPTRERHCGPCVAVGLFSGASLAFCEARGVKHLRWSAKFLSCPRMFKYGLILLNMARCGEVVKLFEAALVLCKHEDWTGQLKFNKKSYHQVSSIGQQRSAQYIHI